MTVRTTLSFTDRHADYLRRKVDEGVYASASSAVAAAVERMIEDEIARDTALEALADEIRARMQARPDSYTGIDAAFAPARALLDDE